MKTWKIANIGLLIALAFACGIGVLVAKDTIFYGEPIRNVVEERSELPVEPEEQMVVDVKGAPLLNISPGTIRVTFR